MLKKIMLLILFLVVFINQSNSQTKNNFNEINKVWYEFYQAFDSLDYQVMAKIHSKKLIRISGGKKIVDYETYINSYKTRFKNAKEDNTTNGISLRFFERINNDSIANERGIYKFIKNKDEHNEQIYYGQFHVILIKENGGWKILMDYDSNNEGTIGEKDYNEAYHINEYNKFIIE